MSLRSDTKIASVRGRQIFDSRGRPTVEADVGLAGGARGRASVPSGASTGRHEAHELRDGDPAVHGGRGVGKAVAAVNAEIAQGLVGHDAGEQKLVDATLRHLDGSEQLGRLGANAVLAVSLAVCRAAARARAVPLHRHIASLAENAAPSLPMPMVNILSGGAHAAQSMDLQDFLVIPIGAASFSDALRMSMQIRRSADEVCARRGLPTLLADEGGLSPACRRVADALDLVVESIESAGFVPGRDVAIAVDVAASGLYTQGKYELRNEGLRLSGDETIAAAREWRNRYPIVSIEDLLHEDDWEGWTRLTSSMPDLQILGDDLFATNVARIDRGIHARAANAVLIKPNQNGTLSGTLDAIAQARRGGFSTIVSARSGETEDSFIADLAVGTGAGQIKIGSVRTSERMAKYNQLVRIEEDASLPFAGWIGRG